MAERNDKAGTPQGGSQNNPGQGKPGAQDASKQGLNPGARQADPDQGKPAGQGGQGLNQGAAQRDPADRNAGQGDQSRNAGGADAAGQMGDKSGKSGFNPGGQKGEPAEGLMDAGAKQGGKQGGEDDDADEITNDPARTTANKDRNTSAQDTKKQG